MGASSVTIVRRLRWDLLTLTAQDAYYEARLRRIIDQLTYAVLVWPLKQWPVTSPDNEPVPSRMEWLALLSALAPGSGCQPCLLRLIRLLL